MKIVVCNHVFIWKLSTLQIKEENVTLYSGILFFFFPCCVLGKLVKERQVISFVAINLFGVKFWLMTQRVYLYPTMPECSFSARYFGCCMQGNHQNRFPVSTHSDGNSPCWRAVPTQPCFSGIQVSLVNTSNSLCQIGTILNQIIFCLLLDPK